MDFCETSSSIPTVHTSFRPWQVQMCWGWFKRLLWEWCNLWQDETVWLLEFNTDLDSAGCCAAIEVSMRWDHKMRSPKCFTTRAPFGLGRAGAVDNPRALTCLGPELSDSVALVIAKDVFPLKIDHLVGGSFDSKKKSNQWCESVPSSLDIWKETFTEKSLLTLSQNGLLTCVSKLHLGFCVQSPSQSRNGCPKRSNAAPDQLL